MKYRIITLVVAILFVLIAVVVNSNKGTNEPQSPASSTTSDSPSFKGLGQ